MDLIVASFEAFPYSHFHSKPFQLNILALWGSTSPAYQHLAGSGLVDHESSFGVGEVLYYTGRSRQMPACRVGGESWVIAVQEAWLPEKACLQISFVDLGAIWLSLQHLCFGKGYNTSQRAALHIKERGKKVFFVPKYP